MRASLLGALGLLALLASVGCKSSVDPDQGRFSCATDAECGDGWECIKQAAGGGRCFKKGQCVAEQCNGKDDNCDGVIDETFGQLNDACNDAGLGQCAAGQLKCLDAGVVCAANLAPVPEVCNGLDDDCNGKIDDPFDLTADNLNCGGCGKACGPGTTCRSSMCRESNCSDGIDNDADGGADCLDPACFGAVCFGAPDASYVCGRLPVPDAGDLDGGTDAGDLDGGTDAGDLDGGPDAGPDLDAGLDAGPSIGCFPPEDCTDGIDNDHDGLTDCADPDCNGRTCVSGTVCTNSVCPGPG